MNYLTFDIGTTNIKSVVYQNSEVVLTGNTPVKTYKNNTQDPKEILSFVVNTIDKAVEKYAIDKVFLSTAMHTFILLDKNYEAIDNMMLWSNTSSEFAFESFSESFRTYCYENTGTPLHSMSPFSKMIKNEKKFTYFSDLKSFLMFNLTHEFVTDHSSASASGMWNFKTKEWDTRILDFLNLDVHQFPKSVEINTSYKFISNPLVEVVIGSTDGVLSNRGIAGLEEIVISAGTSIGLRKLSRKPTLHGGFCYYAGFDTYLIGQASNNGGNVIEYIKRKYPELDYETITTIVENTDYNSFVLPYIYGERGPHWKDGLKLQIDSDLTMESEIQALIYGVFTNVKMMLDNVGTTDNYVYLTGGLFNNEELREIFAKIIKKNIVMYPDDSSVSQALIELVDTQCKTNKKVVEEYHEDESLDEYIKQYEKFIISQMNIYF